jgi:hypothetical protein
MALYGIKVVPATWQYSMPLPFSEAEHKGTEIEQGMRILIYREGEGIVAEGEVHAFAIRPSEWTPQSTAGLPAELQQADYLQPVGLLYSRDDAIGQLEVQAALGAEPLRDWQVISRDAYQQLANWPY